MSNEAGTEVAAAPARSRAELADLAADLVRAVGADVLVVATRSGTLARRCRAAGADVRLVAISPDQEACRHLTDEGLTAVPLSTRVADKYRQARLAIRAAVRAGQAGDGDLVACVVGHRTSLGGGDLVVVTDIDEGATVMGVTDLLRLTDGVRPLVLESVMEVAGRIGRVTLRGKDVGAMFVVGDSDRVLTRTRQLVLNPFRGHDDTARNLTLPSVHDTVVELAKLDGAFIVRGDGVIRTGGAFVLSTEPRVELPEGLGARHVAAAAVTAETDAAAVAVSATDGHIRVFTGGELVMQIHPEMAPD